ncbi:MAG: undecaprenyl diphosphate synthase family protein [Candidatus Methanospirare jalkutatii]|nr:undecaprenyl diphosphate synthase family protein [Candidatus Methanospirare jalkutatii]
MLERRIQRSQTPSHLLLVLNEADILPDWTDETDETEKTEKTGRTGRTGKTGKTERAGRGVFCGGGRKERGERRDEKGDRKKKRSFDGAEKLRQFVRWCHSLRIEEVSIYIGLIREANGKRLESALLEKACERIVERVSEVLRGEDAFVAIYAAPHDSRFYARFFFGGKKTTAKECEKRKIIVSVGLGGKSELTRAFRALATKVRSGEIEPAEIDEKMLEDALIFKSEPELIIRSGSTRLTDFLIWQSVYSELYFTDVNWRKFRRIDLLRAVRDFQMRERRFGR